MANAEKSRPEAAGVAVVGAGLAGLVAVLRLAELGIVATLYEASARPGGRLRTLSGYWDDGQSSEWCGELLNDDHTLMLALARRFSLPVLELDAAGSGRLGLGEDLDASELAEQFQPLLPTLAAEAQAAGDPDHRAASLAACELDQLSVQDWVESRVPGGASSSVGQALLTSSRGEFASDPSDQSALNLILFEQSAEEFAFLGCPRGRLRLEGGNELLPRALAAALPAGVLHYGEMLEGLAQDEDGVTLSFAGGSRRHRRVILAIPFAVLRELELNEARLSPLKRRAICELGAGRSAKLQLQFRERLWSPRWNGSACYGDWCGWEGSWQQPGRAGILTALSGGGTVADHGQPYGDSDDPRVKEAARAHLELLEPLYPGASAAWNGKASLSLPHLDPLARASYAYWRPGQITAFAGVERLPEGRLHFAGEHTSLEYLGFMEGAAREGLRAATELAAAAT